MIFIKPIYLVFCILQKKNYSSVHMFQLIMHFIYTEKNLGVEIFLRLNICDRIFSEINVKSFDELLAFNQSKVIPRWI